MTRTIQTIRGTAAALLLLAAGSVGCKAATDHRGTAQNTYTGDETGQTSEQIGDRTLARQLVMEEVLTRRLEDGRLQVQLKLRSRKVLNLPIEWDVLWFDASGFMLDTPRHWTPASLGGTGYEIIVRTAPTAEAAIFELAVRQPNTVR